MCFSICEPFAKLQLILAMNMFLRDYLECGVPLVCGLN